MIDKQDGQTHSQRKHAAILKASREEFLLNGFAGASMDRIAERACVSKRTVYNHFPSKDALFESSTLELWSRIKEATTLKFDPALSLESQLSRIAHNSWELYRQREFLELARVVMAEFIRTPQQAAEAMAKMAQLEGGLEPWLKDAVNNRALKIEDIELATTQFWGLMKAFSFWPKVFHLAEHDERRQEIIAANVEMFLARYRA
ncbi:TetR/AcrR family transcriptional regulator [Shewanella sp. AS16]|uniref:TetR/AcrR family transcriptional regulator n=1 Tax=Shewanella sp. AS16 TaxID=2907625 RepID=UPI001F404B3D|nr:TetR/AcrR family transcriptional regulator [Shewanella sp. AS16]MCE9687870.1 TetR/AcrR family transcriptional regulator [Shewanella sp. AS16]